MDPALWWTEDELHARVTRAVRWVSHNHPTGLPLDAAYAALRADRPATAPEACPRTRMLVRAFLDRIEALMAP